MHKIILIPLRVIYLLIDYFIRTHFKITVEGKENIPETPQALIVANQPSRVDIPILGHAFLHNLVNISWITSKDNYKSWYLRRLFLLFRVVLVNGSIEETKKELMANRWTIIFPERSNGCNHHEKLEKIRKLSKDAAAISLSTGIPVIPVAMNGTEKVLPPSLIRFEQRYKITVTVDEPLSFKKIEAYKIDEKILDETAEKIMKKIISLTQGENA